MEEFSDWLSDLHAHQIDVNELLELFFRVKYENEDIASVIIDECLADDGYSSAIAEDINEEKALKVLQNKDFFKNGCVKLIVCAAKKLLASKDEEKSSIGYEAIKTVAGMAESETHVTMGMHSIEEADGYGKHLAIDECKYIYGKALIDNTHNELNPTKGLSLLFDVLEADEHQYFIDEDEYDEYKEKAITLFINDKNYNAAYKYLLDMVDIAVYDGDKKYNDFIIASLNKIKDFLGDKDKADIDGIIEDLNNL